MGRAAWVVLIPSRQKQYQMSNLSDMLSSEIATLRAQAAALLSKAAALESALLALAPVAAAEPQPQPQPEAVAEPEAAKKAAKPKTPEQRAAARSANLVFHKREIQGMPCYMNARGDVFYEDGGWWGWWTGSSIDLSAPEPSDLTGYDVVE